MSLVFHNFLIVDIDLVNFMSLVQDSRYRKRYVPKDHIIFKIFIRFIL